ncbi:MAG: hypothetical protein SPK63_04300 [Eubacteriales bacterium]|nr:hypothetical protein [Eubacteriales bacterium]
MYIANELKVVNNKQYDADIRENVLDILYTLISDIIASKRAFDISDFNLEYYDEFELKTNCHEDIFNTIYISINQPSNYKPLKKIPKDKDKIIFPELYYTLDEFKKDLHAEFVANLDSNNIIWMDEYSVCLKATVNKDDAQYDYYFKMIPCLTYYNQNNVKGQMYQKNGGIEIEYIDLAKDNFKKKNDLTDDLFRQTILIYKNLLLKEKNITTLPREIIETFVYNVPNDMFVDDSKRTMINIVNYIRNNSIKLFKTIDEQDYAFTSQYRSMSPIYVRHITKVLEKQIIK